MTQFFNIDALLTCIFSVQLARAQQASLVGDAGLYTHSAGATP